jgi:anti-sigma factor RsiW
MSCDAIRPLLHAHLDGELDLVRELEVERHLADCPACAGACQNLRALQGALRSLLPPIETPPGLWPRIQAGLRQAATPPAPARPLWRRAGTPIAAAAVLAIAAWLLFHDGPLFPWGDRTAEEAVASHQRYEMSRHLDVESPEAVKVRAGLQEKLPFPPFVPDLAALGYPLVGGRLDVMNQRPVEGLVYRHDGHDVSLLAWFAGPGCDAGPMQAAEHQGYHLLHWSQSGWVFWVVSDLPASDLLPFAGLVRAAAPSHCH